MPGNLKHQATSTLSGSMKSTSASRSYSASPDWSITDCKGCQFALFQRRYPASDRYVGAANKRIKGSEYRDSELCETYCGVVANTTCWDRSPRTVPCHRRSSKPCAEIFHASESHGENGLYHAKWTGRNIYSGLLLMWSVRHQRRSYKRAMSSGRILKTHEKFNWSLWLYFFVYSRQ